MAFIVTATELRQNLSECLELAAEGEEILITKSGHPLARLVSFDPPDYLDKLAADLKDLMPDSEVPAPSVERPPNMEKMLSDVSKVLGEQDFASIEDANAFLQQISASGSLPSFAPSTPLEKAQNLIYQAWEEPGRAQRVKLAKRALKISPDCADAYVILAEDDARSVRKEKSYFEQGVAAGERALGEEFDEYVGHFWGITETRPYMRARRGLASCLWAMGDNNAAVDHYREMLRLNPGDNQGIRYELLLCLLEMKDFVGAEALLLENEDEATAIWLYTHALLCYHRHGVSTEANQALAEAHKWNRHVPDYLLGRAEVPNQLPNYISIGEESEALVYAAQNLALWSEEAGALDWLKEQVG